MRSFLTAAKTAFVQPQQRRAAQMITTMQPLVKSGVIQSALAATRTSGVGMKGQMTQKTARSMHKQNFTKTRKNEPELKYDFQTLWNQTSDYDKFKYVFGDEFEISPVEDASSLSFEDRNTVFYRDLCTNIPDMHPELKNMPFHQYLTYKQYAEHVNASNIENDLYKEYINDYPELRKIIGDVVISSDAERVTMMGGAVYMYTDSVYNKNTLTTIGNSHIDGRLMRSSEKLAWLLTQNINIKMSIDNALNFLGLDYSARITADKALELLAPVVRINKINTISQTYIASQTSKITWYGTFKPAAKNMRPIDALKPNDFFYYSAFDDYSNTLFVPKESRAGVNPHYSIHKYEPVVVTNVTSNIEKEFLIKGIVLRFIHDVWTTSNSHRDEFIDLFKHIVREPLHVDSELFLKIQKEMDILIKYTHIEEDPAVLIETKTNAAMTHAFKIIPIRKEEEGQTIFTKDIVINGSLSNIGRIVDDIFKMIVPNSEIEYTSVNANNLNSRNIHYKAEPEERDDLVRAMEYAEENWKISRSKFVPENVTQQCAFNMSVRPRTELGYMPENSKSDAKQDHLMFGVMSQLAYMPIDRVAAFDFSKLRDMNGNQMTGITYLKSYDPDPEWMLGTTPVKYRMHVWYKIKEFNKEKNAHECDVYVAYRGSQTTHDWHVADVAIARNHVEYIDRFRRIYKLNQEIMNDFEADMKRDGDTNNYILTFYATGHSLGGFSAFMHAFYSLGMADYGTEHVTCRSYVYPVAFNPFCGIMHTSRITEILQSIPNGCAYRIYGKHVARTAVPTKIKSLVGTMSTLSKIIGYATVYDPEDAASALLEKLERFPNLSIIQLPPQWLNYIETTNAEEINTPMGYVGVSRGSLGERDGSKWYCANDITPPPDEHAHIMWQFISSLWAYVQKEKQMSTYLSDPERLLKIQLRKDKTIDSPVNGMELGEIAMDALMKMHGLLMPHSAGGARRRSTRANKRYNAKTRRRKDRRRH